MSFSNPIKLLGEIILLTLTFSALFFVPVIVSSQSLQEEINKQNTAFVGKQGANIAQSAVDPRLIVARVIKIALTFLGILFLAYIIYAGFLIMTAAGETERIDQAKKIIRHGVIGIAVVLGSWSIAYLVYDIWIEAQKNPFGSYTEFKIKKDTTDFYNKDPYEESTTKPFDYKSD